MFVELLQFDLDLILALFFIKKNLILNAHNTREENDFFCYFCMHINSESDCVHGIHSFVLLWFCSVEWSGGCYVRVIVHTSLSHFLVLFD